MRTRAASPLALCTVLLTLGMACASDRGQTATTEPIGDQGADHDPSQDADDDAEPGTAEVAEPGEADAAWPSLDGHLVYGPEGIWAIDTGEEAVRLWDTPTAIAAGLGDDIVVAQPSTEPESPAAIVVHRPDGHDELPLDGDEELRLHAVGRVDGAPVAVATSITGASPDENEERLVLIDLADGKRTDLGVVGGWEDRVVSATLVDEMVVLESVAGAQRDLHVRTVDGEEPWPRMPVGEPDTSSTVVVTDTEALLLQVSFTDDGTATVHVVPYDLATGAEGSAFTVTPDVEFEAGFCSVAVWDGVRVVCDDSQGVPFTLDLDTGEVTPLAYEGIGAPGRLID